MEVIERTEGRYDVRELEFGEVRERLSLERVVLECDCRARLVLDGHAAARYSRIEVLECGVCGGRFVLTRMAADRGCTIVGRREARRPEKEHRYSWLEDYLERLEGKEARREYYARLEEVATPR